MTQAETDNTRRLISIADLNTAIDSEPRVLDVMLGERLGMAQPLNIRTTIAKNNSELSLHGKVFTQAINTSSRGGRPGKAYYLNEPQALLICMFSNTARAAEVRKMLIDVFMEYRRAQLGTHHVRAHERRTSTKVDDAIRLKKNIDRLEAVVAGVEPARQVLTAMVIDGEPVVVDVNDYHVPEGERAVVLRHDGSMSVWPVSHIEGGYSGAGVRSAYGPRVPSKHGGTMREGCVIVGRVIERQPHTIDHEPHYRGRRVLYRDEILRLLGTNLTNRQIAQKTGATYQTVTHWRRWAADHRPELIAA